MNCLTAKIADDGQSVALDGGRLPLPAGLRSKPAPGQQVIVGVRPEHLDVTSGDGVQIQVKAIEWLGHECLVSGSVGGQDLIVRQVGMAPTDAGSTMTVTAEPQNVHLFDPATTERMP